MTRRKIDLTRPVRQRNGTPVYGLRSRKNAVYPLTTAPAGEEVNTHEVWTADGRYDQTTFNPKPEDLLNYDRFVALHGKIYNVDNEKWVTAPSWTDPITLAYELNIGEKHPGAFEWT